MTISNCDQLMPIVHFVKTNQAGESIIQDVPYKAGQTVMQVAVDAGTEGIAADCGGLLTCATCHVIVAPDWVQRLPEATADELGMLDFVAAQRQASSRLSCQITLTEALDGLVVELPPTQY